jgi:lipopolysaccharide transport system permease protein
LVLPWQNIMLKATSYWQYWLEFLLALTKKEIKARYKHAVLGFLWIFLNPLLQMLVLGFVFQFFVPIQVDNYFLFLFTGLLPWTFFSVSMTKGTPALVYERALIQKAKFPREAIILSIVLSNLFHFIVALGLLVILSVGDKVLFEAYTWNQILNYSLRMFWVLPLSLCLTAFTSGLALLTGALNVKYRDVNFIVQAIIPLWFYATPIVYSLKLLPTKFFPFFYLNPLTAITEGFHWVFLKQQPAALELTSISLLISLIAIYFGVLIFNQEKKWFDDWF